MICIVGICSFRRLYVSYVLMSVMAIAACYMIEWHWSSDNIRPSQPFLLKAIGFAWQSLMVLCFVACCLDMCSDADDDGNNGVDVEIHIKLTNREFAAARACAKEPSKSADSTSSAPSSKDQPSAQNEPSKKAPSDSNATSKKASSGPRALPSKNPTIDSGHSAEQAKQESATRSK